MSASDSAALKDSHFTMFADVRTYSYICTANYSDIIGHTLQKLLTKSLQSCFVDIISEGVPYWNTEYSDGVCLYTYFL